MAKISRLAFFISGLGTNLMAVHKASKNGEIEAQVALVVSDKRDAPGLAWAKSNGIPAYYVKCPRRKEVEKFKLYTDSLEEILAKLEIELICLSGYLRILPEDFVTRWQGKMVNLHPSLLPSFKGLNVYQKILDASVKVSGCTVHFVVPELDSGPIIYQGVVPVYPNDSVESLQDRVTKVEHKIYSKAIDLVCQKKVYIEKGKISYSHSFNEKCMLIEL